MTRPPAVYWDEPQAASPTDAQTEMIRFTADQTTVYCLAVRNRSVSRHQTVTVHRVNTLFDLAAVASAAASPVGRRPLFVFPTLRALQPAP